MEITGPGIYFTIPIFGGIAVTQTTVSSAVVMLLLCGVGVWLGRGLKKRPDGKQVLTEKLVGMLYKLVGEAMGQHNLRWAPFIGALFLSSILGSLIGMTGIFRSTTADLSTTLAWAVLISVICWVESIKNNGFGSWLKGFTEPIFVMTPMNLISEAAQPVSLAFRHFGNIAGGGVITSMLYLALSGASTALLRLIASSMIAVIAVLLAGGALLVWKPKKKRKLCRILGVIMAVLGVFGLLQWFGVVEDVPVLQVGIPAVLSLYFDVFSGLIQAFVFSLLSMIYISNACPPPEEPKNEP